MSHLRCAKCILKYIFETIDFGLWYSFDTTYVLVGYSDVDRAGCAEDHKTTSGGCFFQGNNLIAWFSKKKNISLSAAEVE